ncbi:MAG: hypothetical protein EXS05_07800 [Planctomycetaceae bacterium]|nr:hypothetical protein [Planctomycetaceae bacterium]
MVPLLAVGTFWYLQVGIVKSSMAAWVAEMVIEHLRLHNGAWPRQWTDLREPFDRCVERSGRSWSFDDLRSRVDVDWEADPKLLARQVDANGQATFRVVYLREGRLDQAVNAEPNQMILDYLRGDQQPNSDALQAEAAR